MTKPYFVLGEDGRSGGDRRLYCFGGGDVRFLAPSIVVGTSHASSKACASVYPHYVSKVEARGRPPRAHAARKGRTKEKVDEILCWLTGDSASELAAQLEQGTDFWRFFAEAPALNSSRKLITGVACGVRVEAATAVLRDERWRGVSARASTSGARRVCTVSTISALSMPWSTRT